MKASREKLGTRTPKLTVDDFSGKNVIGTITGYDEFEVPGEDRLCAVLFFEETGDKALFLNATMMDDLIAAFGTDETDKWIGKKVPLEKRRVTFKGKTHDKVYVVSHEDWDQFLVSTRRSRAAKSAKRRKRA